MPSTIITKNSITASAVPVSGDLVRGELALNLTDGRIYSRDEGTTIVELGTNPSTIAITAGTIDNAVIGATTAVAGTFTNLAATGTLTGTLATAAQPNITSLGTIAALVAGTGQFSTSLNVDGTATMDGLTVDAAGDVAFGTKFFWDASAESLGIGTSSPVRLIDLRTAPTEDWQIRLGANNSDLDTYDIGRDASDGLLHFYGNQTGYTGYVFGGINGERMRIDSSGTVLVGTTTAGSAGAGDIVVSGGVYLGGTGAANKLDDYEEGTWTPVIRTGDSAAWTSVFTENSYTKIGSLVTISLAGTMTATGTNPQSNLYVASPVPFAPRSFSPLVGYGLVVDGGEGGMNFVNTSLSYPFSKLNTVVPAKTVGQTSDFKIFLQYHTNT